MPGENGGTSLDVLMQQLNTLGQAGAAQSTGPSAASALGNNYLNGGKAPVVFWGMNPGTSKGAHNADSLDRAGSELGITPGGAKEVGLQDAVADWYKWSDQERSAFGQRLYKLGLVKDPHDYGSVFSAWQSAVQEASNFYMAAGKKVTPWQVLDIVAGGANGPHSKTQTNTSKSFNIPTVEDAHVATKQIFQALMGRDPDKNELDRYGSMMSAYAQKHPTVTKQTQTTDIHGNTTSSSTSSGGYSAAGVTDMLSDRAKADPEYGSYQAATTYFNALIGAMGGMSGGNG
jgi:hypothetical protein